jgi:ATP-dependent helicase/nuclease subunit A
VLALVAETNAHRQTLATPSWEAAAVRTRVKTDTAIVEAPAGPDRAGNASTAGIARQSALHQAPEDADDEAGMAWGRLVHEALEAAGRGAAGDALAAQCRTILLAVEDPQIDEHDEPVDLDRLIDVVTSVTGSDIWRRASAADTMLVEVPFSIALPLSDYRAVASDERTAAVQVIDGVIDLAFREQDGWVIVDYKSDRDGKGVASEVLVTYKRQVELYAQCWTRLTHEAVRERAILFTTDSEVESW